MSLCNQLTKLHFLSLQLIRGVQQTTAQCIRHVMWPACREDIVVATKVTGPGQMPWIRGGPASLSAKDILEALEGSLKRLQTDYIDIYQLHWPDRCVHKLPASKSAPLLALLVGQ